MSSGDFEDLRH